MLEKAKKKPQKPSVENVTKERKTKRQMQNQKCQKLTTTIFPNLMDSDSLSCDYISYSMNQVSY